MRATIGPMDLKVIPRGLQREPRSCNGVVSDPVQHPASSTPQEDRSYSLSRGKVSRCVNEEKAV